jgi:P63C domain
MSAAHHVVSKFGGPAALSKLIGKGQSTVAYWLKAGTIPARWQSVLLELAAKQSISLYPEDFVKGSEQILPPGSDELPRATHWGELEIGNTQIPCYVLDNGQRVFSLKGIVVGLTGVEGGQLAEYLKVRSLRPFLPTDLVPVEDGTIPALIKFDTGGAAFTRLAIGFPVERFMDVCAAYSEALQQHVQRAAGFELTPRQIEIANRAAGFLRACAKTGIIALVDEATGYQYDRAQDALRLKYTLFLEEEMRKWEKTFPDQLWVEFGRLTKWQGQVHSRPKYWGKLVMELVYGYLDPDVAKWLKENAPKPMHGQNYHQWLSSQYGLKRLVEHIWMLVGMASACRSMSELRAKMAERFGRTPVQLTLYLAPPQPTAPEEKPSA